MAKCPACKIEQVGYNWKTTKNGKKWLSNNSGEWHTCQVNKDKNVKSYFVLKAIDYMFCELCGKHLLNEKICKEHTNLTYTSMEKHKQMLHPNGEILDDIDFMVITDEAKKILRTKWKTPKRTIQYMQFGKRVI